MADVKKTIFYARTYRHLKANWFFEALYFLLFIIPCLIILILNLDFLTERISWYGARILGEMIPGIPLSIRVADYPPFGTIYEVAIRNSLPEFRDVCINILLLIPIFLFLIFGKRKGHPLSIYLLLSGAIHLINCCFLLFAPEYFPYSISTFSDLYIKQQIGIWIIFLIMSGLVTGIIGRGRYISKICTCLVIMMYSIIFAAVRYILFLYILYRYSILYMAMMFFVFGPLVDFLYFVSIYSIFANHIIKRNERERGLLQWEWS